ncbi:MAG: tagaturonate epimerase family protein [Clostridia bacterium]|jgi:hypothetical protein
MKNWRDFYQQHSLPPQSLDVLKATAEEYGIYPESLHELEGDLLFLAKDENRKRLIVIGSGRIFEAFQGDIIIEGQLKSCPLSHENAKVLRQLFPFTAPVSHKGHATTIGLGDRLGLASPGHLKLIKDYPVFPVLAQQSIRELNLTQRTYDEVLDAASWAVFQEGYTNGFGADGDHLKTEEEVQMALDCGYTMITLDCSDHIDNTIIQLSNEEVEARYQLLPKDLVQKLEGKYLNRSFPLENGESITFDPISLKRIVLTYGRSIDYTIKLYNKLLKPLEKAIDFEMSIDETLTPTSPQAHFFVASQLIKGGVNISSLAPRFCGEFQKGIDYIGNIADFEREFVLHQVIASHFGYKISVHSGSDKFSIFPIVGRITEGRVHVKTAGTNWLEAMRIIARFEPALYREMHQYALEHLEEAKQYYQISARTENIPDVHALVDEELPSLMDMDDSRQLIHITYGLILQAQAEDGTSLFRDRLYHAWNSYEKEYEEALIRHIGKHLSKLGIKKRCPED